MPHTHSAEKALRQTEKRKARNRATKKALKVQTKRFLGVITEGTAEQQLTEFKMTVKKLDKAAARNVIHKNAAARKKSQMAKKLNAAKA